MKKVGCFLCFSLQFLIWAASASRPTPHHHHQLRSSADRKSSDAAAFSVSKIGSSQPRCTDKCHGCTPYEPIEVPVTTDSGGGWGRQKHHGHGHGFRESPGVIRVQYTIYEPAEWKCKCCPCLCSP